MLISTLLLMGCQTFQVHPFEVGITLPYSENCRFKNVVTKAIREVEPVECERIKKRSLILTSDAWRVIRTDIQNNCAQQQCAELNGKLDAIFLEIDQGLNQIPW
jgi:hypothetical protein